MAKEFVLESRREFIAYTKLHGSPATCIMENYVYIRV
jgi:hypothetical protein